MGNYPPKVHTSLWNWAETSSQQFSRVSSWFVLQSCKFLFTHEIPGLVNHRIYQRNFEPVCPGITLSPKHQRSWALSAQRQFFFSFHSILHCVAGPFPDVYKVALKVLDRRYTGPKVVRLKQIQEYQIAVRDQMAPFTRNDGRQVGIQLAVAAHGVSWEYMEVACELISAKPEKYSYWPEKEIWWYPSHTYTHKLCLMSIYSFLLPGSLA